MTFLIPIFIGIAAVLQGTLNKNMSLKIGLTNTLLLGNSLVLIFTFFIFLAVKKFPEFFPALMHIKGEASEIRYWYLIPSILGLIIIFLLPYGFSIMATSKMIIFIVLSQLLTSLLWDYYIEKMPINKMTILGLIFSFMAVFFTTRSS